jgi:hypothetical protein
VQERMLKIAGGNFRKFEKVAKGSKFARGKFSLTFHITNRLAIDAILDATPHTVTQIRSG